MWHSANEALLVTPIEQSFVELNQLSERDKLHSVAWWFTMTTLPPVSFFVYLFFLYLDIFQYTHNPHCPEYSDACTCTKNQFRTSWCCRPLCYNVLAALPSGTGPNACPNNCWVFCDRTDQFYCCYCDGQSTTRYNNSITGLWWIIMNIWDEAGINK